MRIILFLSSLILLGSCLDKIDLEVPEGLDNSIVIRGELVKGEYSFLYVYLDRVFNFDANSLRPLKARSVILLDEVGNQWKIPEYSDGLHFESFHSSFNSPIEIKIGGQYRLQVELFDDRVFESALEVILPTPGAGSLYAELKIQSIVNEERNRIEEIPLIQFFVNTPLKLESQEENARLHWTVERTYKITDNTERSCYITRKLDFDKIHLLDGSILSGDSAEGIPLSQAQLNFELGEGYYYSVYQKSLTEDAFQYWNETKQIIERVGNLFEAPAGRIRTNFKNIEDENDQVFGYFMAYAQDTVRVYVPPTQFETEDRFCPPNVPPPPGGGCPVLVCCECKSVSGSQLEKPVFWKE